MAIPTQWSWRRFWEHPLLGQTLPRVLAPIILAALGAVIAYFGWWRSPQVDVVGEMEYGVHAWPPEALQMLHTQELQKFLQPPSQSEPSPAQKDATPFDPDDLYTKVFSYRMFDSVWFISLVNRGTLQASAVTLRLPEGTLLWSLRKEAEGSVRSEKNQRLVDVGDLSPGQRARVVAWGAMGVSESAAAQVVLSHQQGTGRITVRSPARPGARWVESYWRWLIGASLALFTATAYVSFRFGKRLRASEHPEEPTTSPKELKQRRRRRR